MNRYTLKKAGIDVNEGIHRFNGNKQLYETYLKGFVDDKYYGVMLDAIEAGDVEACFQAAHALKGITGTVCLTELYDNLKPLVEEFRAGSMDNVDKLLPPVKEARDKAVEVLKEQIAKEQEENNQNA